MDEITVYSPTVLAVEVYALPGPQPFYDEAEAEAQFIALLNANLADRPQTFSSRSAMVAQIGIGVTRPDGTVWRASGLAYRWKSGATEIPDMPGLIPDGQRTFRHYGATADGVANDKAAIVAALNTAAPVDGEHVTYGVSGSVEPTALKLSLSNAFFKQLSPSTSNCRTLFINGLSTWELDNVEIDMGGSFSVGTIADYAGLRINGGSGRLKDVVVHNGGPNVGIAVLNCNGVHMHGCIVRNMNWVLTGITDDVLQGIWIASSANVTCVDCRAYDFTGTNGGVSTVKFTRGFALAGCTNLKLIGCYVRNVDQGFDTSGSGGNERIAYTNCIAEAIGTWGFKFANTAAYGVVSNCIARDCGAGGFVASCWGSDLSPAKNTQHLSFSNCRAINTGSNGLFGVVAGFKLVSNIFSPTFPQFITFDHCEAIDDQAVKTMDYGFYSEAALTAGSASGNYLHNCTSVGHITARQFGFNEAEQTADATGNATFPKRVTIGQHLTVTKLIATTRQNIALANGDNNNIAIDYTYNRITGPTAGFAVTGFVPTLLDGQSLVIRNTTSQAMTIRHASGLSLAANRIRTLTAADVVLPAQQSFAEFIYDGAESIWILLAYTGV